MSDKNKINPLDLLHSTEELAQIPEDSDIGSLKINPKNIEAILNAMNEEEFKDLVSDFTEELYEAGLIDKPQLDGKMPEDLKKAFLKLITDELEIYYRRRKAIQIEQRIRDKTFQEYIKKVVEINNKYFSKYKDEIDIKYGKLTKLWGELTKPLDIKIGPLNLNVIQAPLEIYRFLKRRSHNKKVYPELAKEKKKLEEKIEKIVGIKTKKEVVKDIEEWDTLSLEEKAKRELEYGIPSRDELGELTFFRNWYPDLTEKFPDKIIKKEGEGSIIEAIKERDKEGKSNGLEYALEGFDIRELITEKPYQGFDNIDAWYDERNKDKPPEKERKLPYKELHKYIYPLNTKGDFKVLLSYITKFKGQGQLNKYSKDTKIIAKIEHKLRERYDEYYLQLEGLLKTWRQFAIWHGTLLRMLNMIDDISDKNKKEIKKELEEFSPLLNLYSDKEKLQQLLIILKTEPHIIIYLFKHIDISTYEKILNKIETKYEELKNAKKNAIDSLKNLKHIITNWKKIRIIDKEDAEELANFLKKIVHERLSSKKEQYKSIANPMEYEFTEIPIIFYDNYIDRLTGAKKKSFNFFVLFDLLDIGRALKKLAELDEEDKLEDLEIAEEIDEFDKLTGNITSRIKVLKNLLPYEFKEQEVTDRIKVTAQGDNLKIEEHKIKIPEKLDELLNEIKTAQKKLASQDIKDLSELEKLFSIPFINPFNFELAVLQSLRLLFIRPDTTDANEQININDLPKYIFEGNGVNPEEYKEYILTQSIGQIKKFIKDYESKKTPKHIPTEQRMASHTYKSRKTEYDGFLAFIDNFFIALEELSVDKRLSDLNAKTRKLGYWLDRISNQIISSYVDGRGYLVNLPKKYKKKFKGSAIIPKFEWTKRYMNKITEFNPNVYMRLKKIDKKDPRKESSLFENKEIRDINEPTWASSPVSPELYHDNKNIDLNNPNRNKIKYLEGLKFVPNFLRKIGTKQAKYLYLAYNDSVNYYLGTGVNDKGEKYYKYGVHDNMPTRYKVFLAKYKYYVPEEYNKKLLYSPLTTIQPKYNKFRNTIGYLFPFFVYREGRDYFTNMPFRFPAFQYWTDRLPDITDPKIHKALQKDAVLPENYNIDDEKIKEEIRSKMPDGLKGAEFDKRREQKDSLTGRITLFAQYIKNTGIIPGTNVKVYGTDYPIMLLKGITNTQFVLKGYDSGYFPLYKELEKQIGYGAYYFGLATGEPVKDDTLIYKNLSQKGILGEIMAEAVYLHEVLFANVKDNYEKNKRARILNRKMTEILGLYYYAKSIGADTFANKEQLRKTFYNSASAADYIYLSKDLLSLFYWKYFPKVMAQHFKTITGYDPIKGEHTYIDYNVVSEYIDIMEQAFRKEEKYLDKYEKKPYGPNYNFEFGELNNPLVYTGEVIDNLKGWKEYMKWIDWIEYMSIYTYGIVNKVVNRGKVKYRVDTNLPYENPIKEGLLRKIKDFFKETEPLGRIGVGPVKYMGDKRLYPLMYMNSFGNLRHGFTRYLDQAIYAEDTNFYDILKEFKKDTEKGMINIDYGKISILAR